ncbi:MmgE/PrpD family protein [Arthrobacter globiformis]|uniref:MmgE/PrpD family protein n=1 Tax=Arthrobacter globiformis TaxID=1665 RepID=A0A328HFJ3_ARTGO|nr:MmgE/PrpD family protein [Arthrobacter globiformis]RAM37399.1 MmgE/PrpD family protein [Arthrobacter globiformis]
MPAHAKDLVQHLASFVAETTYAGTPPEAAETAKKSILDTFGVILAASGTEPAVHGLVDLVKESAGRPESSILAFGGKAPAMMAALANGAMAHCLDFDDQTPWGQHASSSIVPAAFAVAERLGGVTGQDMIAAVAAGQDIFARLRCNVTWKKDWNLSSVMGVFAATAAAGRVLGLSQEQMVSAFGIATMQSSGVMELVAGTGGDVRGMYAGFSAKGAVLAALLAARGVTGVPTVLEGEFGFFKTYFADYDRDAILNGLGRKFEGAGTLYKLWPTVGTAHSHIHAIIELLNENGLHLDEVKQIRLHVGDYHDLMCRPLQERRAPATLVDAKFSLPFLVAVAAVHRGVKVSHFTTESLKDRRVLAVAQKVVTVSDPTLDWKLELPPGRVELEMIDGRKFQKVGSGVPGNSEAPLTWDTIGQKFRDCASASVRPLEADQVIAAEHLARHLESAADVVELVRLLAPPN